MATAIGRASIVVVPSFDGISKKIEQGIAQPLANASKKAGQVLQQGVGTAAANAAKDVEKAQYRVLKSTQELEKAEGKLEEKKQRQVAAAKAVEAAEENLKRVRESGNGDVLRAEQQLESKRASAIKAANDLSKAEQDVERAKAESVRASESLEQREKTLEDAQDDLAKTLGKTREEVAGMEQDFDGLGDTMIDTAEKSKGFGERIMDGFKTIGKGALLGVGAKIGSSVMDGVHTAISAGWERLQNVEQAEKMLQGLGHSAEDVDLIMKNAMDSVKGTAFGFGEAAKMASTFVGAGVEEGEDLQRVLTLVGDTASITGSDFNEMGAIWTKIASNQKLSTEELNQLMDRGLGLLPELQKKYGVTAEEARKMVSEGKVSFEDFADVMENMVGGAAQGMGDTVSGSAANARAALGRLGEKLLEPVFDAAPAIFQAMGSAFDQIGEALSPVISQVGEWLKPILENLAENVIPALANGFAETVEKMTDFAGWVSENRDWLEALGVALGIVVGGLTLMNFQHQVAMAGGFLKWLQQVTKMTKIAAAAQKAFNFALKDNPIGFVITLIAAVVGGLTYFFTQTETGQKIWADFTSFLADAWDFVVEKLGVGWAWVRDNVFTPIADFAQNVLWPVLKTVFAAIGDAFKAVGDAIKWAWDNVIKPTWDFIVEAGKFLFQVLATVVFAPILVAWEALSTGIQWAWENIIRPAWDALQAAAVWMWQNVLVPAFEGIKWAFEALGDGIMWVWENVIKVAWDVMSNAANWLWQNVLVPAFDGIVAAWNALADGIMWVWDNVIRVAWDAVAAAATWLWENVLSPTFTFIGDAWQALGDGIRWVYDNIIQPAWDAVAAGINWLWENAIQPTVNWIEDKWRWLGDRFNGVKDFIVDTVFGGLKRGLDTLQDWFRTAVDAIRRIWDGIKAAAAAPVRFVVDTVYNNGIKKAWNAVAHFTGLDTLDEVPLGELGQYARGGILPGYTPGRDPYTFIEPKTGMRIGLSGGEGIMRPEWVRAVGGKNAVDQMNQAAISGGVRGVQRLLGGDPSGFVAKYAKGGMFYPNGDTEHKEDVSSKVVDAQNFVRSQHGKPYQWGGVGNPSWDCSGLWSGIVQVINGGNGFGGRLFNTISFMADPGKFGFSPGLHGPVTVGVSDDHMAGTLGGINAESASDPKGVQLGGSAWGSDNGYFPRQYTMDAILGEFISGGNGGGGGFNIMGAVKSIWDGVMNILPKWDGPGLIGRLPGAMLKHLAEAAWNTVKEAASKFMSFFGGGGGNAGDAESWRDMAVWAMRREGFNADDPAQVNAMLAQIMSESGGDPNRAQEIVDVNGTGESAGVGLLQIIPDTFAANRDPELPNDRRNPEANMVAALRYYKGRYGMDLTTMWGHGHGYARGGVLPGFTPGRDVHQFWSPTAGAIALSGGESIMVPEWTRAVGGPSAVARMNAAASGGRTGSTGTAFAAGGVWGGAVDDWTRQIRDEINRTINDVQHDINRTVTDIQNHVDRAVADFQQAVRDFQIAAEKIANPNTLEGVAARSFAGKSAEILGELGFSRTSGFISGSLGIEKSYNDEVRGHAERLQDLADKERELEDARNALHAAEVAQYEDAEQRQKAIAQASDNLAKAERALSDARFRSAAGLDMTIHSIVPQLYDFSMQAARLTTAFPPLSAAFTAFAATVGPAGMSVGIALQGMLASIQMFKLAVSTIKGIIQDAINFVKKIIQTIKDILEKISEFVTGIINARGKMRELQAAALQQQGELAKVVDDLRSKVVELRVSWVEAQVALRDATWKTRLAQADVVRAQLEGVKSVAEAEAALEQERKRVSRKAMQNFDDMSLAYDRYRWLEYQGWQDRLDLAAQVTPEILALEAEVNAARLNAVLNQREASLAALNASFEQQKAAMNLMQVQQDLASQTQMLAIMSGKAFGYDQVESLQAMNTANLYGAKNAAQAQIGKSWWRPTYWLTGAGFADAKRISELDKQIRQREKEGKGAGAPVFGTGLMSFFGYEDSAANRVKNSGYGQAEQAMADFQEKQQIQQIELQKKQLEQQIEQNKLFVEYQKQVGDLQAEIESLRAGASSAQYQADAYREENPAVRSAIEELAKFEAGRSAQYADVAAGRRQVVEITVPQQDTYTREQVDALLRAVQQVDSIDARVTMLETPPKPGANQVLQDITRRY